MDDKETLLNRLATLDGKDYGRYQSLRGQYDLGPFRLGIHRIPKDPYAPPLAGRYTVQVNRQAPGVIQYAIDNRIQEIAFRDFLARRFFAAGQRIAGGRRGTGYSGVITVDAPGQAILDRNSVALEEGTMEVRCFLGLPSRGRRIDAGTAAAMLFEELPAIVKEAFSDDATAIRNLRRHVETAEDSEYLRRQLEPMGLAAFVADGSILPRSSGTSDRPLPESEALPFAAPESLSMEVDLPHAGRITGMGIPTGVTLIVGGGFHGKSTLLHALELGCYNHLPGDGREFCAAVPQAVKIRAYSGRSIRGTDISPFIDNLPLGRDTASFSTDNASGSTSQAAGIVEAMEMGARVLLMDEDTCAANFMVRDAKMQQLVHGDDEPITPYLHWARALYADRGISSILVLGGVGDYFDVCDHVIQMIRYQARDVTRRARAIARAAPIEAGRRNRPTPTASRGRTPLAESIDPHNAYGKQSIFAKEVRSLHFGRQVIDLTDLEQLLELAQTRALGYALDYARRYMDRRACLAEIIQRVMRDVETEGLDVLSDRIAGHFAEFRSFELAFALNRLRSLKIQGTHRRNPQEES